MIARISALIIALTILCPAIARAADVSVVCVSETKQREIMRFNFDTAKQVMVSGGFDDEAFPVNQPLQVDDQNFTWDVKKPNGTTYHFVLDRSTLVLNFVKKQSEFGDLPFNFHSVCQLNKKQI